MQRTHHVEAGPGKATEGKKPPGQAQESEAHSHTQAHSYVSETYFLGTSGPAFGFE